MSLGVLFDSYPITISKVLIFKLKPDVCLLEMNEIDSFKVIE